MLLQDLFRDRKAVITVSPDDTVAQATRKMKEEDVGAVVVIEDEKVVGILTDRDVALTTVLDDASGDSPVRDVMTKKVETIWGDQGVFNATQYFANCKVRRLPVVEKRTNRLLGLVTVDDLFAFLSRELFNVSKALEPALHEQV
jgi:CBS domain-containing protein